MCTHRRVIIAGLVLWYTNHTTGSRSKMSKKPLVHFARSFGCRTPGFGPGKEQSTITHIARSSNGRTPGFGPGYWGSSPCRAAKEYNDEDARQGLERFSM